MKLIKSTVAALILGSAAASANAALIEYDVSDARNNNGNDIGHGLYTFGKHGTGHAKYSIQNGTVFTIDDKGTSSNADDTASLVGTAFNGTNVAHINVNFSDFAETYNYKREGGKNYNANPGAYDITDVLAGPGNGDVDFFRSILGTVTIGQTIFDIATCVDCPNENSPFGFQFGDGANAKSNSDFGGSAWVGVGPSFDKQSHWDFNLKFTPRDVPEPSTVMLMTLGLVGFGLMRRRKHSA